MKLFVGLFVYVLPLVLEKDILVDAETTTPVTQTENATTSSTITDGTTTASNALSTTDAFTVIQTTNTDNSNGTSTSDTTTSLSTNVDTTMETTSNGSTTSPVQTTDGLTSTSTDSTTSHISTATSSVETSSTDVITDVSMTSSTSTTDVTETVTTSSTSTTGVTETVSTPSTSTTGVTETTSTSFTSTTDVTETVSTPSASTTDVTETVSTPSASTTDVTENLSTSLSSTTESIITSTSTNSWGSSRSTLDMGTTGTSSELPQRSSSLDPSTTGFVEVSTTPYISTTIATDTDDYLGVIIALSVILGMVIIILISFCVYVGLNCQRKHKTVEKDADSIGEFSNKSFDNKPPKPDIKPPADTFVIKHEENISKDDKPMRKPKLKTKSSQTDTFIESKTPAEKQSTAREDNNIQNGNKPTLLSPKKHTKFCQTEDIVLKSVKSQTVDRNDFKSSLKTQQFDLSAAPEVAKPVVSRTQSGRVVVLHAEKTELHPGNAFSKGENSVLRSKVDAACQTEAHRFKTDEEVVVLKQESVFNDVVDKENNPDNEMYWFDASTKQTWISNEFKENGVPQKLGGHPGLDNLMIEGNSTSLGYDLPPVTNFEKTTTTYGKLIGEFEDLHAFETIHKLFEKHDIERRTNHDHDVRSIRSSRPVSKRSTNLKHRSSSVSPIPTEHGAAQKMTRRRYKDIYTHMLNNLLKPGVKSKREAEKLTQTNDLEDIQGVSSDFNLFDTSERTNINSRFAKRKQLRRI